MGGATPALAQRPVAACKRSRERRDTARIRSGASSGGRRPGSSKVRWMPLDALPTIAREECFSQRLRVQVSCGVSSYSGYPHRKGILLEPQILTQSSASSSAQDRGSSCRCWTASPRRRTWPRSKRRRRARSVDLRTPSTWSSRATRRHDADARHAKCGDRGRSGRSGVGWGGWGGRGKLCFVARALLQTFAMCACVWLWTRTIVAGDIFGLPVHAHVASCSALRRWGRPAMGLGRQCAR